MSGTAALYDGMLQMVHPDRVVDGGRSRQAAAGRAGLSADRRARPQPRAQGGRSGAVRKVPALPEWQDAAWLRQQDWPAFAEALRALHHPADPAEVAARDAGLVAARL